MPLDLLGNPSRFFVYNERVSVLDRPPSGGVVSATTPPEIMHLDYMPDVPYMMGSAILVPEVSLLADAVPDQWEQAQLRNMQVLGRAALYLASQVEKTAGEADRSLSSRFRLAHEGDRFALESLCADGASSVTEMICKSGARMSYEYDIVDGRVMLGKQDTEERQFNTRTTFSHMFNGLDQMSNVEGVNAFAIEEAIKSDKFRRGDLIVECSLIPEAPIEDLKGSGLFLRESIAIIRTTRLGENGKLVINSLLVSGTDQDVLPDVATLQNSEQEAAVERQAMANRFDISAFRTLLAELGVPNTAGMTPTNILESPLLVRGENFDGTDIAMKYDEIVYRLTGKQVMMGSTKLYRQLAKAGGLLTRQDYERHFVQMAQMQADITSMGDEIARGCAREWQAVAGDDYGAGRLLHKLSERAAARYLANRLAAEVSDPETYRGMARPDFTVMGVDAYKHLMTFQQQVRLGDLAAAGRSLMMAENSAKGTGCPSGMKQQGGGSGVGDIGISPGGNGESSEDEDDGMGDRVFECMNGHINTRPKGEKIPYCRVSTCDSSRGWPKGTSVGC